MTMFSVFTSIEPWLYLISSGIFFFILAVSASAMKTHKLKISFMILVISQIIAYLIWSLDYIITLSPIIIFVATILDTLNPILIFIVMLDSLKPKRK